MKSTLIPWVARLVLFAPLGGLASLFLAIVALVRWRGGWRIAGVLPLLLLLLILALTVVSGLIAQTNNSLLALALVPACLINLIYIVFLLLLRRRKRTVHSRNDKKQHRF